MPNRILRESVRTSPTVDSLSESAEVLFYRLITVADDFGRFEADPRILRSMCFPLRVDYMTTETMVTLYGELAAAGLVRTYHVNGKTFGQFVTWGKYQRVRAAKSKYPEPPIQATSPTDDSNLPSTADIGGQPPSNVPVFVFESRNTRVEGERASANAWKSPLPQKFVLTPEMRQVSAKHGLRTTPEAEFEKFCAYHRDKGTTSASWESAWESWCIKSHEFKGPSRSSSPPSRHVASAAEIEAFTAKQAAEFNQRAKEENEREAAAAKNKERIL